MKISSKISDRFQQLTDVIVHEFMTISTSYAVLLVLIGGIFVYGFLYNLMYAPNLVTEAPIAVVDRSGTKMSREFIQWMDATSQISVHTHALNMVEAKDLMRRGVVQAILFLPDDFETRVYRGEASTFPFYAQTDAFLYYEALQEACANVMLAINEKYRSVEALFMPPEGLLAAAVAQPIKTVGTPLFNHTDGYGSYLIPAVLMIILFQTLSILVAMLCGMEHQDKSLLNYTVYGHGWGTAVRIIGAKAFVYSCIYGIFAYFFFAVLPMIFSLPDIGKSFDIMMILIPFFLGTVFYGLSFSKWFTDGEAPLLMITVMSVPYIFLSGVSYPLENMPWYWQACHFIFPATSGTLAYVKVNSMGASLADVHQEYISLWCQVAVYFTISLIIYRQKIMRLFKAKQAESLLPMVEDRCILGEEDKDIIS